MIERLLIRGSEFSEEFSQVVKEYLLLLPYDFSEGTKHLHEVGEKIISEKAVSYYRNTRDIPWKEAKENGKYEEGILAITEGLSDLENQGFSDGDIKTITVFLLRRIGYIYEYWATYGNVELPGDAPDKNAHFLLAAFYYMLADIKLGVMTDYVHRVMESLIGTGFDEVGIRAAEIFWGNNISQDDAIQIAEPIDLALIEAQSTGLSLIKTSTARIFTGYLKDPKSEPIEDNLPPTS